MPSIALINDWSVDTQLDIAYLMEYIKAITSFRTKRFKIYVTMNMIGVPYTISKFLNYLYVVM